MAVSTDRQRADTVRIREILRDTVVAFPADSSLVRALVECDSTGRAYLRELEEYRAGSRLPPPRVAIDDNVLTATAAIDSMAIYMEMKDRYIEAARTEREVVVQTVEVNRLTGWQKFWIRTGQLLAAAAVAVAGYRVYKLVKR